MGENNVIWWKDLCGNRSEYDAFWVSACLPGDVLTKKIRKKKQQLHGNTYDLHK